MSIDPNTDLPKDRDRALSLTRVLRQCQDIEVLVAESGRNLSAVDLAIKHYLESPAAPPAVSDAEPVPRRRYRGRGHGLWECPSDLAQRPSANLA
jgi:hypothetical protein